MPLEFESTWLLATLLLLPLVLIVLRYSLVDSPRAQLACSACIRACVMVLLVLAISGALWVSRSRDVAVVVLADLSDSAPEDAPAQLQAWLAKLEERVANPERGGLVVFGEGAQVLTPVQHHPKFPDELTPPAGKGDTHIEEALLLAREMMPSGTVNRLVLMSDGNETLGNALSAAKQLSRHGISVYTLPYRSDQRNEVLLEDLIVPSEVKTGQSFEISAIAHADTAGPANFILYRDGFKVEEREIELKEGANTLSFEEHHPGDGLTKYQLHVKTQQDFFVDNNVASGIVHVAGEPRVLLLEGDEREGRHLSRALEAENIRVDLREGRGMPGTLDEVAAFDAIIVSDVPATDLSTAQMTLLRSYIEDLGGGFIMIGGEESFGLGGYYRTPVEEALPIHMRAEKKKDTPSLAMMLIIDKSGSMEGDKMELAKEAAIAAVELLGDNDHVGVVGFDSAPYWIVDLQSAAGKAGIIQTVSTIEAGGGTSIYPALEEGFSALQGVPATFKHVVLLTDGQSEQGDFAGIVDQMVTELITVSAVAVGEGADTVLLQDIARWGRGRYYFTADPYDIPQIFAKETMKASKSSLVEEPFVAQVSRSTQVIQAIDWSSAPFLFGYVVTTPKATSEIALVTERGDPLLASWRYGLGKTAAFTSDAKSRWGADWLGWPGYGKFWAQLVRDVMRTSQNRGTETKIAFKGNTGHLLVDNIDESGNFLNRLQAQAQVITPGLSTLTIPLAQTAPGRYEAEVPMKEVGSYLFKVRQTLESGPADAQEEPAVVADFTRGVTISYKPEYRHLSTNEAFLKELAAVSGGKYQPELEELFTVTEADAVPVRHRLWPWLIAAALLLFLIDVALRRLDLAGLSWLGAPRRYG